MQKGQNIANFGGNRQELQKNLRSAVQYNQKLTRQNNHLYASIDDHMEDDWEELRREKAHLQFNGQHYSALQRVKEQLADALQAFGRPKQGTFEHLKQFKSEESIPQRQSEALEQDFQRLISTCGQLRNCSPALREELKSQLQLYHNKILKIQEQLIQERSISERHQQQKMFLEEALNDEKQANSIIHNKLLEATRQLKNIEFLKTQLSNVEQDRNRLNSAIQKIQKQNKVVKNNTNDFSLAKDDESYGQIRKCYKQIAALKEKIAQAQVEEIDGRSSFQTQRAQLELENLLTYKRLQESEMLVKELQAKVQKMEREVIISYDQARELNEYRQEVYILRIKNFALESLQIGSKHKLSNNNHLEDFVEKMKPLCQKGDKWKLQALKMMAETHSILKQFQIKLEEIESEKDKYKGKSRSYKQKYMLVSKERQKVEEEMMDNFKIKCDEYNKLIEKMQTELERKHNLQEESSLRQIADLITAPLQQQLQLVTTENAFLRKELAFKDPLLTQQAQRHHSEATQLHGEIQKLKQQNNILIRENRQSKSMMLEHNLNLAISKMNQSSINKNQGKKSQLMSPEKNQNSSLEQQITILNSRLREQADLLSKETVKNQRLANINMTQHSQLQEAKAKIRQLTNQSKELNGPKSSQPTVKTEQIHIGVQELKLLRAQIANLKDQISKERTFEGQLSQRAEKSLEQSRGYRKRIEELQEMLKKMDKTIRSKEEQIIRLQHERDLFEQQNQKLEEQIQTLRGNANSLKEIEWLEENKQLEEQMEKIKNQLYQKSQALKAAEIQIQKLRKECDSFEEDNFKLLLIINQHNIKIQESSSLINKIEEDRNHKIRQLEQKIKSLTEDNDVLKNLIEEMRNNQVSSSVHCLPSKNDSTEIFQLNAALIKAQNDANQYKEEIEELQKKRAQDRLHFQADWDKLVSEVTSLSRELQFYQKGGAVPFAGKGSFSSKGAVISEKDGSQMTDEFKDGKIVKSQIIDLMSQLEIKNHIIRQLKEELRQAKYMIKDQVVYPSKDKIQQEEEWVQTSANLWKMPQRQSVMSEEKHEVNDVAVGPDNEDESGDIYLRQLFELREQNQRLREAKYTIQSKMRYLEQEYNSLKIKLISGNSNQLSNRFEYNLPFTSIQTRQQPSYTNFYDYRPRAEQSFSIKPMPQFKKQQPNLFQIHVQPVQTSLQAQQPYKISSNSSSNRDFVRSSESVGGTSNRQASFPQLLNKNTTERTHENSSEPNLLFYQKYAQKQMRTKQNQRQLSALVPMVQSIDYPKSDR